MFTKIIISFTFAFLFLINSSYSQKNTIKPFENISDFCITSQLTEKTSFHSTSQFNNLWKMVQTPSFPYYITDLFFIDSLYGWASHSGVGIGIVKTTNSGYSWDSIQFSSVGDFLGGIYFVDRNTGWTCGSSGTIRKTTNGGNNWFSQDFFNISNCYTVFFENANTGYIGGYNNVDRALLIKTTNSGNNWHRILEDSINIHTEIFRQYWIDSKTGWFGGRQFFVKTTDGGNTFTNILTNVSSNYSIEGIFFLNENTGWISGNDGTGRNIYKTTNSGLNWHYQYNPVSQYSFPQINDIKFISNDTGWASALLGFILKTTNGGENWIIENDTNVEFSHLFTYKKSKIWCGADFGQIWYLDINKTTSITNNNSTINDYRLFQNYPNPFNPTTVIRYSLNKNSFTILKVFDVLGKEVATLVNEEQTTGMYEVHFDGNNLPGGIYFYKLQSDGFNTIKKMVLIK